LDGWIVYERERKEVLLELGRERQDGQDKVGKSWLALIVHVRLMDSSGMVDDGMK
jgi:hypothetical protein